MRIECKIILLAQILTTVASTENENESERKHEINKLELENSILLKKIHEAIDDTVDSLKKDNNSMSAVGIARMLELKNNLFNETTNETTSQNDFRRFKAVTIATIDPLFDVDKIVGERDRMDRKKKIKARKEMKKRLDEWLIERKIEQQKIAEYKKEQRHMIEKGTQEKCPRFGWKKEKRKYSYRRSEKRNETKTTRNPKRSKKSLNYPCCRKCCKSSYMGCL